VTHRVLVPLDRYNDRQATMLAESLQGAGLEVLHCGPTGLDHSSVAIVNAALREQADAICVLILTGRKIGLFADILSLLEKDPTKEILLCGGGLIHPEDAVHLPKNWWGRLFGPGTPVRDYVTYLQDELPRRRKT